MTWRNSSFAPAGLTLLELLVTLSILALLLSVALPGFSEIVEQKRIDISARQLQQSIELARTAAITKNGLVTLCRSRDGQTCGGRWQEGILIFVDYDGDRRIDDDDLVVRYVEFHEFDGSLTWRAFQNRQYLQITPLGFTNYQNGNFTLCPPNGDRRYARQLIITRTGRVRHAQDSDGDGIREDSRGRPLRC